MAGANPTMLIRVAATISELKANLAEGKNQIETTTAAMQKLATSFSGDRLIQAANNVTAAVNQVGGASKLSEAEMARVNATLTKAIEKYQLLGREAPQAMIDLEKQTRSINPPTDAARMSVGQLAASYVTAQVALDVFKSSVRAIVGFITDSVKAYGEAEAAQMKLVAALRAQGNATPDIIKQYNDLAAQFQRTTVFGDDLVNEMQALFVQVGDVGPEQMERAVSAAANLSAGLGIDLQQATMLVAKGLEGNTGALKRYGVVIDASALKTRGADAVFEAIQRKFGGQAVAQADTYTGRVQMMGNAWNNFQEAIGEVLVNDPSVREFLRTATQLMGDLSGSNEQAVTSVGKLVNAWRGWMELVNPGLKLRREQVELNDVLHTTEEQVKAMTARFKEMDSPLKGLTNQTFDFSGAQDKAKEALEKYNKEAAEAKRLAEEHAKAIKALRDQLSGAGLAKDLSDLQEAWKTLTPAQRADRDVVQAMIEKYEGLREHLKPGALPANLEDVRAKFQAVLASATPVNTAFSTMAFLMPDVARGHLDLVVALNDVLDGLESNTDQLYADAAALDETAQMTAAFKGATEQAAEHTKDWGETLGVLAGALTQMGATAGGTLATVLKFAGAGVQSIEKLSAAMKTMGSETATTSQKMSAGISTGIMFMQMVQSIGKALDEASRQRNIRAIMEQAGRDYGLAITEGTAASILATGSRNILGSLDKVINDQGGITLRNFEKFGAALNDALTAMTPGGGRRSAFILSIEEMSKTVETVFPQMAKVIVDNNLLASQSFLDLIAREEELGLHTAAVTDFLKGRVEVAIGGLKTFVENAAVTSQAAADGMVGAIVGMFDAMVRRGVPMAELLKQIDPLIVALQKQFTAAGLSGGDAFAEISRLAAVARDEIAGPALTAVGGLNQTLIALQQSGLLNQVTFEGLARQVADTFASLIAQGKSGDDILRLMAPTLQTIWELQQDFGFAVDEATQALLDQAVAGGVVGDAHRSAQERIAAAMDKVVETLDRIADALRAVPRAANTAADGVNDAIARLPKKITIPVDFPTTGGPALPKDGGRSPTNSFAAGSNGFRDFGAGTLAVLHGREAVVREGQASPSGAGSAQTLTDKRLAAIEQLLRRHPSDVARAVRDAILLSQ